MCRKERNAILRRDSSEECWKLDGLKIAMKMPKKEWNEVEKLLSEKGV
jgi:hypothetical protein